MLSAVLLSCLLVMMPAELARAIPPDEAAGAATSWLGDQDVAALAPGIRAEVALGLLAGGDADGAVAIRDELLGAQVDAETLAKLIVLTAATGADPASIDDQDLVARLDDLRAEQKDRIDQADSAIGPAWGILAYRWADRPVPQPVIDQLADYADPEGSGAYGKRDRSGFVPEVATTALVIMALSLMGDLDQQTDAVDWLEGQRDTDGSFPGPSKINSTGLAVAALTDLGRDESVGQQWLADQELPDGGLPARAGGGGDIGATSQGILGLTGTGYATLSANAGTELDGQAEDPAANAAPLGQQGLGLPMLVAAAIVIGIVALLAGIMLGKRSRRGGHV